MACSGMSTGVNTILPSHASLGFYFYLVNIHGLIYQQKVHINPHFFRLTLVASKSRSNSVHEASHELEIQLE